MDARVELIAVPLENGTSCLECSRCGPLGIEDTDVAKSALFAHLASEHPVTSRI